MNEIERKLVAHLFDTRALRVCPENRPFWYTSGTIGPYYVNTHFLYGSEEKAVKFLEVTDAALSDKLECPLRLVGLAGKNYREDAAYREIMDILCGHIKSSVNLDEIDYISGGERRDWFFSLLAAEMLGRPHISIFKDLGSVISEKGKSREADDISGKNVLHIADLITEASSYERAWIPALKRMGGTMAASVVIVDRNQGGREFLEGQGVRSEALIYIDEWLFREALKLSLINKSQYEMISEFIADPKTSMRNFLIRNPEFLEEALAGDPKTRQRAALLVEKDLYGLK